MKFAVRIEDKSYEIPDSFTVEKWMKLSNWNIKQKDEWPYIVAAATGAPIGPLQLMETEDPEMLTFAISLVFASLNLTSKGIQSKIDEYTLLNLETLTLGEFIDLDVIAIDAKIDQLISSLYKMPIEKAKALDITIAYPAIVNYNSWRRSVYQSYKELFDYKDTHLTEESSPDDKRLTPAHAWYESVMVLCDGKFENIDYVVRRPFREAFNWLAWKKTKMNEERMHMVELQNKMKKA